MSNRDVQPLRFACQTCGQAIDITFRPGGMDMEGAGQTDTITPFDSDTNFVDLHLDFPVTFEKYKMGFTPFIKASQRIGPEAMQLHSQRLNYLDSNRDKRRVFFTMLKHYKREKITPFRLVGKRKFDLELASEKPQDFNAALYNLLAIMMWPYALPGDNEDTVALFLNVTGPLFTSNKQTFEAFVTEVIDSGFLKKLQHDCLSIYPKMLEAELTLRPALFLDFDTEYTNAPIAMRVSTSDFESYKDIYKDIAEIISRQLVLVAGVNNLIERSDHNAFKPKIGLTKAGKDFTPKSLDEFSKIDLGRKLTFIDDNWYEFKDGGSDNQLRNAIAHFKTEYDDISQLITYYPSKEGLKAKKSKEISFLEFMRQLLIAYREMHRLHHLIKALFYYKYLEMN
jgi:hypothetical protein